jgi:hypothetical protein
MKNLSLSVKTDFQVQNSNCVIIQHFVSGYYSLRIKVVPDGSGDHFLLTASRLPLGFTHAVSVGIKGFSQ